MRDTIQTKNSSGQAQLSKKGFCVLILGTPDPSLHGSAMVLLRLFRYWPPGGIRPVLVTPMEGPLTREASKLGVEVEIIPGFDLGSYQGHFQILKGFPSYLRSLVSLAGIVRRRNARVMVAQNRRLLLTTLPTALALRLHRVWLLFLGFASGPDRVLNRLCLRLSSRVVIESKHQACLNFGAAVAARASSRIRIIPTGVDLPDPVSEPRADGAPRTGHDGCGQLKVGTVASITPRKGLETLIAAVFEAADCIAEAFIAGAPITPEGNAYLKRLQALAAGDAHSPRVTFLGYMDDVASFYRSLDLFVLPSRNEGISVSVREAMLTGLPVIATDVGGMRDLIEHGKTGLLVPPDAPSALAQAIRKLAKDQGLRSSIGRAAREHVRTHFDPRKFAKSYYRLFKTLA